MTPHPPSSDPSPVVVLENAQHRYGRHQVLQGIDLTVSPGECAVLYGANGSGKSTLLALLSTRYTLREGRYLLDGIDVRQEPHEARARLLFIGHHTHLYGHLTPLENLQFFTSLRTIPTTDQQLRHVINTVGLNKAVDKPVQWFSAGMRKRLALARLLLAHPKLLLLDEPYSALDTQGVGWLNAMLTTFLHNGGSLIMASHDPERVAALPHRPWQLARGRLHPISNAQESEAC
ncbi:MAG: heme ABC exporter ATP-binding protein CcmA [Magnetococcales bacterium]|nr:heme ABC exporter ATP-binding protein CcmA [Magnetococcales bacterium]NGZ05367.1 heme ABC exporter ATP-binding protein CcmA [Magnetococcales bacterium]